MKNFRAIFASLCVILFFTACGSDKKNEDETAKLGSSCSVLGEETCSADSSEIFVCKNYIWHTKKICELNFGEYCQKTESGSYICATLVNNPDQSDDSDSSSLPDANLNEDSDMPDSTDDSDISQENGIEPGETRETDCTGLPANASWNTASSITQTWDGEEWTPSTEATFSTSASTTKCRFVCNENYSWNDIECVAETRTADCSGLPENAEWNIASNITQSWDGEEWTPSSTGTYNSNSSSEECRFKCIENYNWNGTECVAGSRQGTCAPKPANSVWNDDGANGFFPQTWDGTDWVPQTHASAYSTSPDTCHFKCATNYIWNDSTSKCVPASQQAECTGLPENAQWNTASSIVQTWDGSEWIPSSTGSFNTSASNYECYFKCKEHYNWNGSICKAATQPATCTGLPENAKWNSVSDITQTWNGSSWEPSNVGSFNKTASTEECRFKCNEHFSWENSQCVADTQPATCIGLPDNAEWNTVRSITQSWNGSDWTPLATGTYNTVPSTEECRFKCKEEYHWENPGCVSNIRVNAQCSGLPVNASWNSVSSINQNWTSSNGWQPSTTGVYNTVESSEECRFKCNEHYNWSIATSTCNPETQQGNCSGTLPEHAVWNDNGANGKFTQTWSSSGWTPASYASSYSATAGICKFKCDKNYNWNNSKCDAAQTQQVNCTGLPDNAEWNTVSKITQTWDNYLGMWVPSNTGSYNTEGSDSQCRFKCKSGFTWKDSLCLGAGSTRTADCTGLPDFAQWNFATSITQTYNGYSWTPSTNGTYNSTGSYMACYFKCFDDYTWTYQDDNGSYLNKYMCLGEGSKKTANCTDLPNHAQWNTVSSITQTYHKYQKYDMWGNKDGYTYSWEPDLSARYNTTPSLSECRYICESSYDYDGNGKCVKIGDTQTAYCTSLPDENATYNTASNITQTWDGSVWTPSNVSTYNTTASTTQCRFKCNSGYSYNNSNCRSTNQRNLGVICTGQSYCYNNSASLTCPTSSSADFFGQDTQYKSLCTPKSLISKTVSEAFIFEDLNTWLMWQKSVPSDKYTWENAVSYCDGSTYAGYTDWRLPTPQELLTIINNGTYNSALAFSVSVSSDTRLWSSKKNGTSNNVFILNPYYGSIASDQETSTYNLLCVRGNTLPVSSFTESTVSGKVVVKDSNTGLMWQKTYLTDKTWQQALKECEDSNYAGYTNWRLPNKNELASLLNYNKTSAPYSGFSGMPSKTFWSSTTLSSSYSSAWVINFETALAGTDSKTATSNYVRCVRNQ